MKQVAALDKFRIFKSIFLGKPAFYDIAKCNSFGNKMFKSRCMYEDIVSLFCVWCVSGVGSASQLLDSSESKSQDRLSLLKQKIADLLDTGPDNIDIISVRDAADTPGSVDVTYAAHGSPYYTPEKLDALVWMNRRDVSSHVTPCQISEI